MPCRRGCLVDVGVRDALLDGQLQRGRGDLRGLRVLGGDLNEHGGRVSDHSSLGCATKVNKTLCEIYCDSG